MFWNVFLGKQSLIIFSLLPFLSSIAEIKTFKQDLYDIRAEVGDTSKINMSIKTTKTHALHT